MDLDSSADFESPNSPLSTAMPGDSHLPPLLDDAPQRSDSSDGDRDGSRSPDMGLDYGTSSQPVLMATPPYKLALHDAAIKCACPVGTPRVVKDLLFAGAGRHGPTWMHIPCNVVAKISSTGSSAVSACTTSDSSHASTGQALDSEKIFLALLGPSPTESQRIKMKNFTSTFLCDGPCKGSKYFRDFFVCKKCCSWQHRLCMLFGDAGDCGLPVCNRCYISFLVFHDRIVQVRRKRTVQAVQLAYEYLKDRKNRHQAWRKAFCSKFIARFMAHNQAYYHKWVVSERRRRLRVKVPTPVTSSRSPDMFKGGEGTRVLRPRQTRNATQLSAPNYLSDRVEPGNGLAEDTREHNRPTNENVATAVGNDEATIVPAPPSRLQRTSRTQAPKVTAQPARAAHNKSFSKRRACRARSLTPSLPPHSQIYHSSAPRKSAPKSKATSDDQEDEEETEDEEPVITASSRRRSAPLTQSEPNLTSCKCQISPPAKDCFSCRGCRLYQHHDCAEDTRDGLPKLCNFCFNRPTSEPVSESMPRPPVLPTPLHPHPVAPPVPAPAPRDQTSEDFDAAIRDEVDQLCPTIFWKQYCSINTPCDAPGSATHPKYPPPQWLDAMQLCCRKLLDAAGRPHIKTTLVPVLSTFPRRATVILEALREMAVEHYFHGSNAGRSGELGVLAVVLGLDSERWVLGGG